MRIVFSLKWSIIISALLITVVLIMPASSWADSPGIISLGNVSSILTNPIGVSNGGINPGQDLSFSQGTPPENPLSYEGFNFNANSPQISNMSLLERMYRNTHFYDSMGRAYEGVTAMPTWILPTKYTKSAITMYNWSNVNAIALSYTQPGTHLTQRFWSLGITSPDNPTMSDLDNVNIGGQIPQLIS